MREFQMDSRVVRNRNEERPKDGIEAPHKGIIQILWVIPTRVKFELPIVPGDHSSDAVEHFPERRMNVMVECPLDVVRGEFTKMSLIPGETV